MFDPKPKNQRPILWPLAFIIPGGAVAITLNTQWAFAHLESPLLVLQGTAATGLLLSAFARWRKERWPLGAYLGGIFSCALLSWLTLGLPLHWQMALSMRRDPQEMQPQEVRMAAGEIYDSIASSKASATRAEFIRLFVIGYLDGVLNPDDDSADGSRKDGYALGLSRGQKDSRDRPAIVASVIKDYGYREIEVSGTWQAGFEFNAFVPENVAPRQEWWLSFVSGAKPPNIPFEGSLRMKAVRLKVRGYLSPKGRYGHLGMSQWQFFATSWTVLPADPSSTRP